ncbi:UNVERIFIED_CONTAM: hypothetical protein Sradi_4376900 [Sesamum radiatum]|uniref:Uncharacterized protein n=1 Tax=Sesamum radiatum TaxID=300843 RepID=A0AAW2NSF6_SESRA
MDLGELQLKPVKTPLVGFGGGEVIPARTVDLPVSIGEEPTSNICMIQFLVVETPFAYNVVLVLPGLNMFQAVVSTYHLKMKFLTKRGIREVKCDQREVRRCYDLSLKRADQGRKEKKRICEQGGEVKDSKRIKPKRTEPVKDTRMWSSCKVNQTGLQRSDRK